MFCTKCGKRIDYNSTVCNECARAENSFFDASQQYNTDSQPQIVEPMPEKPKGSRMVGFGGALASAILGYIAMAFAMFAFMLWLGVASFDKIVAFVFFFCVSALVMSIIAIVNGAKAIKVSRESIPRPIATLVLGIVGVVGAVGTYILLAYSVMFALSIMFANL